MFTQIVIIGLQLSAGKVFSLIRPLNRFPILTHTCVINVVSFFFESATPRLSKLTLLRLFFSRIYKFLNHRFSPSLLKRQKSWYAPVAIVVFLKIFDCVVRKLLKIQLNQRYINLTNQALNFHDGHLYAN